MLLPPLNFLNTSAPLFSTHVKCRRMCGSRANLTLLRLVWVFTSTLSACTQFSFVPTLSRLIYSYICHLWSVVRVSFSYRKSLSPSYTMTHCVVSFPSSAACSGSLCTRLPQMLQGRRLGSRHLQDYSTAPVSCIFSVSTLFLGECSASHISMTRRGRS
jgi:hypothetical protein